MFVGLWVEAVVGIDRRKQIHACTQPFTLRWQKQTEAKCLAVVGRGTYEEMLCVILLQFNLIKSPSVVC